MNMKITLFCLSYCFAAVIAEMTIGEILKMKERSAVRDHDDNNSIKSNIEEDLAEYDKIPCMCDWRKQGVVSAVKNKGNCKNSSWAFAAVGLLEGQLSQIEQTLTVLSVQNLLDCDSESSNQGCEGGIVKKALEYVEKEGISTEKSYPYNTEGDGNCENQEPDGIKKGEVKITDIKLPAGIENIMRREVSQTGPITAMIYASPTFLSYSGGIFVGDDCLNNYPNYNVLIVGYDITDNSTAHWIVKNWMGEDWGEDGYARIAYGRNVCGIADFPQKIDLYVVP